MRGFEEPFVPASPDDGEEEQRIFDAGIGYHHQKSTHSAQRFLFSVWEGFLSTININAFIIFTYYRDTMKRIKQESRSATSSISQCLSHRLSVAQETLKIAAENSRLPVCRMEMRRRLSQCRWRNHSGRDSGWLST
jgi:hypothetical protein